MRIFLPICLLLIFEFFQTGCSPDHPDLIDPDPIDTLDPIQHSILIGKWKLISRYGEEESKFYFNGFEFITGTSICTEIDASIAFNENPNTFHEDGGYITHDTLIKNYLDTTYLLNHVMLDTFSYPWKDYGDSISLVFILSPVNDYLKILELSPSSIEISRHRSQGYVWHGQGEYRKSTTYSIYEKIE